MWFHHQIAPQSVAYNLAVAVSVPTDMDLRALQRAFQKLSTHHAVMRTLFAEKDGQPSNSIAFQSQDASAWGKDQLQQQLERTVYRPFDLTKGPTWRICIYENAPIDDTAGANENAREHLVLLTLHYILCD